MILSVPGFEWDAGDQDECRKHGVSLAAGFRSNSRRPRRPIGGETTRPPPPHAALCRSRRNWKNSTPSRSRRFIICGLRTISPTMEAIFGARK